MAKTKRTSSIQTQIVLCEHIMLVVVIDRSGNHTGAKLEYNHEQNHRFDGKGQ
jgi:hypothetical protein